MAEPISRKLALSLTGRQWGELEQRLWELQRREQWNGDLPILLLNRCWLRLTTLRVRDLLLRLPPDISREAPELARYRELLSAGHPSWVAQQLCWDDFGSQACREALLRFWDAQDRGNNGWTLERYLHLMGEYRRRFQEQSPRPLPLMVLARADRRGRNENHRLLWLGPDDVPQDRSMRHTCH